MSTTSRAVSSTPVTHRATPERIMARYPVRPVEALRAMRALIDNPDDTAEVFRVIRALAYSKSAALSSPFSTTARGCTRCPKDRSATSTRASWTPSTSRRVGSKKRAS